MLALLTEIIGLLVGGISELALGIGQGLQSLVTAIFVTGGGTESDPYQLTVFGGLIIVFCGISLAIGLSRFVMNFVQTLGN